MTGTPPFALKAIDHVVIRARDIETMKAFYLDVVGCTIVRHNEPLGLWHLRAGTSMIDLVDITRNPGGGEAPAAGANMDHVALRVEPFDDATIREHLAAHGVEPGTTANRFGAEGAGLSIYFPDPEGNGVELKGPAS